MWSGERMTRRQLTSRPDHLWPELWKSMGKHAKRKEKQKWSNEKFHLENARKLRGIMFIDPEDKEFKETIKNARMKLETSTAPAMPCNVSRTSVCNPYLILCVHVDNHAQWTLLVDRRSSSWCLHDSLLGWLKNNAVKRVTSVIRIVSCCFMCSGLHARYTDAFQWWWLFLFPAWAVWACTRSHSSRLIVSDC